MPIKSLFFNKKILTVLLTIFFVFVLFLILGNSLTHEINRDQNQFVASGEQLSQNGLLPYRDYPYFHPPLGVLIYGALFKFTNYPLLTATIFTAFCAWLALIIIFYLSWQLLAGVKTKWRLVISTCAVLLLMANPLFIFTTGRAWNHDLQILLLLLALASYWQALKKQSLKYLIAVGILLGLTLGARLTLAPLAFFLALWHTPVSSAVKKTTQFVWLSAGLLLGLIPSLPVIFLAPRQFFFGNFQHTAISTIYWQTQNYATAMTWTGKFIFFLQEVLIKPGNLVIILTLTVALFLLSISKRKNKQLPPDLNLLLLLVVLMIVGALVPTPTWYWYFYGPIPFIALLIITISAYLIKNHPQKTKLVLGSVVIVTLITTITAIPYYKKNLTILTQPNRWVPLQVHNFSQKLNSLITTGPVLTLAPLFTLETGLATYPEFTASPFAWRANALVPENFGRQFKLVGPNNLDDFLKSRLPSAIITGFEDPKIEATMIEYAKKNNYQPNSLPDKITPYPLTVWLKTN